VAEQWKQRGYRRVTALRGGVDAWRRSGYEIEVPHA
jgi:rhodanese-related sulfurtransferase